MTIAKYARFISAGLFLIALASPCFDTNKEIGQSWEGAALLLSGCFGFFLSVTTATWLANPALLFSWIFVNKKPRQSLLLSIIAAITAALFLCCKIIITDEAGGTSVIVGYRIGYWLWLLSMLTMLSGNLYAWFYNNNAERRSDYK